MCTHLESEGYWGFRYEYVSITFMNILIQSYVIAHLFITICIGENLFWKLLDYSVKLEWNILLLPWRGIQIRPRLSIVDFSRRRWRGFELFTTSGFCEIKLSFFQRYHSPSGRIYSRPFHCVEENLGLFLTVRSSVLLPSDPQENSLIIQEVNSEELTIIFWYSRQGQSHSTSTLKFASFPVFFLFGRTGCCCCWCLLPCLFLVFPMQLPDSGMWMNI